MDKGFFLRGLGVGLSIAAPVGPIGILCIRRSLTDGMSRGLAAGLGAATADAVYAVFAAFGLTAVSHFLLRGQFWVSLGGGLFLCFLGFRTLFAGTTDKTVATHGGGLGSIYVSTFILTLANPATILSFVAVFAGLGLAAEANAATASELVGGVFVGSALWWFFLSGSVACFRSRVSAGGMLAINRGSGVVLLLFGLYALYRAWQ